MTIPAMFCRSITFNLRHASILGLLFLMSSSVRSGWSGGELTGSRTTTRNGAPQGQGPNAAELRAHYASRQAALAQTLQETEAIIAHSAYRHAARTTVVRPVKDQYGDPMYGAYGPRAYAGTPLYNGPAYTASFEIDRQIPYWVLDGRSRLYWPGAQSDPGYVPRTDVNLGVGTSQSFIQHGMLMHHGSVAPSYARPMQFNNR